MPSRYRSNLAQARLGSLEKDLRMTGTNFNLATSIFFVVCGNVSQWNKSCANLISPKGYLLMQLPSNLLLTRVRPSIYLATAMTLWGVVSTSQSAVHSFGALVAARICLGFVEAPFFPGAIMIM